ncbi:MAG TPA: hypothetical protein VF765_34995 [Polyangiaceae bacterium]
MRTSPQVMPTASGLECVRVLIGLGWLAAHWTEAECHLENGRFAIRVPMDAVISSERVAELASLAGITPIAFVAGLERVRRQEVAAFVAPRGRHASQ